MANCTICNKPVILVPSAQERAAKFGGTPGDYIGLFMTHSRCALEQRHADTLALIRERARTSQNARPGVVVAFVQL
jgi:hypothetical protein